MSAKSNQQQHDLLEENLMANYRTPVFVLVTAALALSGCSSTESNEGPSASPESESAQAEESTAPATPLNQAEWIELCDPDGGTNPEDPQCTANAEDGSLTTGQAGQWVDHAEMDPNGDTDDGEFNWQVKVEPEVEYATTIPNGADNPDYDGGNAETVDAVAQEGLRYAIIRYTVRNADKTPAMPTSPGFWNSVITTDGSEFQGTAEGEEVSANLSRAEGGDLHGQDLNPNREVKQVFVVQVEPDQEVASVIFSDVYMESDWRTQIDL